MSAFADYRAAIAADIAIVKTLAETNTAALASAENRLAAAIEQMNTRFGELNQRIDRLLDGREAECLGTRSTTAQRWFRSMHHVRSTR